MTIQKNKSPLAEVSQFYREKKSQKGAILDIPEKGLIELYPAGYVHHSQRDGIKRQETHREIWERAVSTGANDGDLFPFKKKSHFIQLVADPTNEHDPNAVHVLIRARPGSILWELDGRDLGFIPMKISKQIAKNIKMFNGGQILKVRANFHKKYYTTKVVLAYGNTTFSTLSRTAMNRFKAILAE